MHASQQWWSYGIDQKDIQYLVSLYKPEGAYFEHFGICYSKINLYGTRYDVNDICILPRNTSVTLVKANIAYSAVMAMLPYYWLQHRSDFALTTEKKLALADEPKGSQYGYNGEIFQAWWRQEMETFSA